MWSQIFRVGFMSVVLQLALITDALPLPSSLSSISDSILVNQSSSFLSPHPVIPVQRRMASKSGNLCGLTLRSDHTDRCDDNDLESKSFVFLKDKLTQGKIVPPKGNSDCDHTLEINQLTQLIDMGATAMSIDRNELCSRLFPKVSSRAQVPASLRERFRRTLERQENLFYVPPAVNQAKKNLLMGRQPGGQPENLTLDAKMIRLAVTVVLNKQLKEIKTTATLLGDLLQSLGNIPPLVVAKSVPASHRAITRAQALEANRPKSNNPFTTELVNEWKSGLMARVQDVIDKNQNIYTPTNNRGPGGTLRSEKICTGTKRKAAPTTAGQGEPSSKKAKTVKRDEPTDAEEEDCVEDDVVSISAGLLRSSSGSATSTASPGQSTATSTRSAPHIIGTDAVSSTSRPTASDITASGSKAKVEHSLLDSHPLVTTTTISYSTSSRPFASAPTRSSALSPQTSKPSSAVPSPVLASAPARATRGPGLATPYAASPPLSKVPSVAPLAQQKAPAAKRPIAPLPLRGSGLSKPAKSTRPLTLRRALD